MTLRQRLALTTVAVGLPLIFAMSSYHELAHQRAEQQALLTLALFQMQAGGRERCEAAPAKWVGGREHHPPQDAQPPLPPDSLGPDGPPPPPWENPALRPTWPLGQGSPHHIDVLLYGYSEAGVSLNPGAPLLDKTLSAALQAGASTAETMGASGECNKQFLVRMPWTSGPCAYVVACRPDNGWKLGLQPPPWRFILIPLCIALTSIFVAIGPVVRRLRQLTREVQSAAGSHYTALQVTVEGGDEIASLGKAFNEAGREIRMQTAKQLEREHTLRDFLENTTHDVMIPLTVLQGTLTALKETGIQDDLLQSACNEAHYIASLVHNLGVAAKIEAGEPDPQRQPIDMNALVGRAVARHMPLARPHGVQLECAVPEDVVLLKGDVTLVEQAVSNVIYNAVRYNHPGGHVAVTLETSVSGVLVRVADDGPGIASQDMSQLMTRYFRGNEARTRVPGHGLGLHIAYKVCAAHGWVLTLQKSVYGGLQVDFTIPPEPPTDA